jgi:predicted nuclease with RNAse H fold
MNERWAGVDVGGRRKGFHVALVDGRRVLAGPRQLPTPADVAAWLAEWKPCLVGVDAPRVLGDDAVRFESERRLAREVCHLRYTPTRAALEYQRTTRAPKYYEWIEHGLELYAALAAAGLDAVECFPTAAWTRWLGPRNGVPRALWSARALRGLRLTGVPDGLGQDGRDAIGAAMAAWALHAGCAERFGDIVVPISGTRAPVRGARPVVTSARTAAKTRASR